MYINICDHTYPCTHTKYPKNKKGYKLKYLITIRKDFLKNI